MQLLKICGYMNIKNIKKIILIITTILFLSFKGKTQVSDTAKYFPKGWCLPPTNKAFN